jgi:small subunit ribosomal protein S2
MTEVSMKEMLEAGVHFGHKRDRWNPKMAPYIFTERNGVHIFDLAKTKESLEVAQKFAAKIAADGGTVLFVGTKNQTQAVLKAAAESCGMPYLVERWPGGMLTNFNTILGRLKYLKDAEEKLAAGGPESTTANTGLTKKELLNLKREMEKLNAVFEGVKDLRRVPEALFVADIVKEKIAIKEAKKLGIPVIGIADTNAKPDVEYVIPANDDAVRSVEYIANKLAEAIAAQKKQLSEAAAADVKAEEVDVKIDKELVAEITAAEEKIDEKEEKTEKAAK